MVNEILLLCKFDSSTVIVSQSIDCSIFDNLVDIICNTWKELDRAKIGLSYSIPGHRKCILRNDDDLRHLFSIANAFLLKYVEVFMELVGRVCEGEQTVCFDEESTVLHNQSRQAVCIMPSVVNRIGNQCVDNENVILSECSSSRDRGLLSSCWSNEITHVGQIFEGGVKQFRDALRKFSIEVGFKFSYVKNNKKKVVAVCSKKYEENCGWRICASVSKVTGFCLVKNFDNTHSCGEFMGPDYGAKRLSFSQIAELILKQIKVNSSLSAKDVVKHFRTNYGLDIPYKRAWKAVEKAKGMIYGDAVESFKLLRWYVDAALTTNSGSHIVLDVDNVSSRFRRLFVSFSACIKGFKFCRPLLFMDGTFLKGRCKGVILSTTGNDGNQGLFPLAYAVVDSETKDNWYWFLSELIKIVDGDRVLNFISDRNDGLLDALPRIFPDGNHLFCLQHLKRNLREKFCGSRFTNSFREHLVWLFRECAHASSKADFTKKLDELKKIGSPIVERFLENLPYENWTNAYSKGCRYGEMSSNAAESFNAWILKERDLPIIMMVDNMRIKLMEWFSERRQVAAAWNGILCPSMLEKLNGFVKEGRTWSVKKCSQWIYEIFSNPSCKVDIRTRSCSCLNWQLSGFPCIHASVVICRCSLPLGDIVDQYFHVINYRMSYDQLINPIPSMLLSEFDLSNAPDILAPTTKRQPGRSHKRRFRSRGEVVRRIKCGRCGKIGNHNRKTCKEPL